MINILIAIFGCLIISFVVFGGSQVFIPYFKILLVNILKIPHDTWDSILSIANSTPGVFGTKIGLISGYLAAEGHWWAYLIMIITYMIFSIVPIIIMLLVMKKYNKLKSSKFMESFLKLMKPIIAGILISVVINLLLTLILPFVNFNDLNNYISIKKDNFFVGWRYWVLLSWTTISIPIDFYMIRKFKINIIYIIVINITLCLILFQPWIN